MPARRAAGFESRSKGILPRIGSTLARISRPRRTTGSRLQGIGRLSWRRQISLTERATMALPRQFASAAQTRIDLARHGGRGDTNSNPGVGLLARQNGVARSHSALFRQVRFPSASRKMDRRTSLANRTRLRPTRRRRHRIKRTSGLVPQRTMAAGSGGPSTHIACFTRSKPFFRSSAFITGCN
jgi:hypothetical protein